MLEQGLFWLLAVGVRDLEIVAKIAKDATKQPARVRTHESTASSTHPPVERKHLLHWSINCNHNRIASHALGVGDLGGCTTNAYIRIQWRKPLGGERISPHAEILLAQQETGR